MAISKIEQKIKDGALGLTAGSGLDQHVAIGVSSAGPENELHWFTDPETVKETYKTGPLVDKLVYHLENAGGVVGALRITASADGTAGTVTVKRGGAGDSTATMTVSGKPLDAYEVIVRITQAAASLAANAAAFVLSLDGGDTWSPETALPVSGIYDVPDTGLKLTFVDGTFAIEDRFSFDCKAPGYSVTDVNAAFEALRKDADEVFRFVHLVGAAADAAGTATSAAAVASKMALEENNFRYTYTWIEAADDTDAALKTAFSGFVSPRVNVVAGYCELMANGRVMKRSAAWPAIVRRMQQTPQRDLCRTAEDGAGGALPGVMKLHRDEYLTPGLDDARFTTLRTWPGVKGFFVGNGRLMYGAGSDFQKLQYRELMDVACTTNYRAVFPYIGSDELVVEEDTGHIDEISARNIESKVNAAHETAMLQKTPSWVSAVRTRIVRDHNIISTSKLKTSVRITPKGYASDIESEIGFHNPALGAA